MKSFLVSSLTKDPRRIFSMVGEEKQELMKIAFKNRLLHFGNRLDCYVPVFPLAPYQIESYIPPAVSRFDIISLTGTACQLQCDHCKGFLLHGMHHLSGSRLKDVLITKIKEGVRGFLLSGGSDKDGSVPFHEHLLDIKQVKQEYNVDVVLHTGLLTKQDIILLKDACIDGVIFDVVGSKDTLARVCHLPQSPDIFFEMIENCKTLGLPVMPHVVVSLDYGVIRGEVEALERIAPLKPDVLVLVVLMPVKGTPMADVDIDPVAVEDILILARLLNPSIPVHLGCAKPPGDLKSRIERVAVECGYNAIAFPLEETITKARNTGLEVFFHDRCCSLRPKVGKNNHPI